MKLTHYKNLYDLVLTPDEIMSLRTKKLDAKIIDSEGNETERHVTLEYKPNVLRVTRAFFPPDSHEHNAAVTRIYVNEDCVLRLEQIGSMGFNDKAEDITYIIRDEHLSEKKLKF